MRDGGSVSIALTCRLTTFLSGRSFQTVVLAGVAMNLGGGMSRENVSLATLTPTSRSMIGTSELDERDARVDGVLASPSVATDDER